MEFGTPEMEFGSQVGTRWGRPEFHLRWITVYLCDPIPSG